MFINIIVLELSIMIAVILVVNLMKHWTLLFLPKILETEFSVKDEAMVFYVLLFYTVYYYGMMLGTWFWKKVEDNTSSRTSVLVSLFALGLSNFLQGMSGSIKKFVLIRFLTGFCCNVNKIGVSYVHENIPKSHRKAAFFINSGSNLLGTIAGPFFGELLLKQTKSFLVASLFVSVLCFLVMFTKFLFQMNSKSPKMASNEEPSILFRRFPSTVRDTTKELIISCFWTNKTSRNLIFCYIVNSCCLQSDFVLTSILFTEKFHSQDTNISKESIAYCDFICALIGIGCLTFAHFSVPKLISYKSFVIFIIFYGMTCTILTPFIKLQSTNGDTFESLFKTFYILKYAICYYLYTSLMKYFVSLSVFKPYRKQLNEFLSTMKSFIDGSIFNLLIPLLYFTGKNDTFLNLGFLRFGIPFLIIGILQLSTIYTMISFSLPKAESHMEK